MPRYNYKCSNCGLIETYTLQISDDPKVMKYCPACDSFSLLRTISNPSFIIKHDKLGKWFKDNTGKDFLGDK